MDDTLWNHVEAAKSKRPDLQPDSRSREPMRAGIKPADRRAPSSDQKRVRRQMSKDSSTSISRTATTEENTMSEQHTEADLLAKMAGAKTLAEQSFYGEALTDLRNARRDQISVDAGLDFDAMREDAPSGTQYLLEPLTASASMGASAGGLDWLRDIVPDSHDDKVISTAMNAEATLWYEGLWDEVKSSPMEFTAAARRAAARTASQFGLQHEEASSVFLGKVAFLHQQERGQKVAFDEVQPGPYAIPNGSKLPVADDQKTFDGTVNGENGETKDPKSNNLDSPSLKEGDTPDGDHSQSTAPAVSDTDGAKYVKDTAGDTSWTDRMETQGSISFFSSLRRALAGDDPKTDTSTSPSLAEGDQPDGDKSSAEADKPQPAQDLSHQTDADRPGGGVNWGAGGGASKDQTGAYTSSLKDLGAAIEAEATTANTKVFARALTRISSLDDRFSEYTGSQIVDFVLASADVSEANRHALATLKQAAETSTCKHCGRHIEKDSDGRWVDPEATGDDSVWRETCDDHDTFTAEHEPKTAKTAGEYQGGSPKSGDTATCHADGQKIEFFDGAWYHLKGGPSHNDVHPGSKKSESAKTAEGETVCSVCGDKIQRDPEGEENRGWHHDNGETHDHEAKPKGGDSDSGGSKPWEKEGSQSAPFVREAVHLTNVRIDDRAGLVCKGKDPSGNEVKFKVSKEDMDSIAHVLFSDLAINFSGVEIEESDIVKSAGESPRFPYKCPSCGHTWTKTTLYGGETCSKCGTKGEMNLPKKAVMVRVAGESVEVARIPECDVCKFDLGKSGVPAAYDGATIMGPWANMCEEHFSSHGVGLGTGRGQRLLLRAAAAEGDSKVYIYNGKSEFYSGLISGARVKILGPAYGDGRVEVTLADQRAPSIVVDKSDLTPVSTGARHTAGWAILTPDGKPLWGMVHDTEDEAKAHFDKVKDRKDQLVPKNISTYQVGKVGAKHSDGSGEWKVQVAGTGEDVWSQNSITFDSKEEAEAAAKDLGSRWFGMDMARVVPSSTPNREAVDPSDPAIVLNYR